MSWTSKKGYEPLSQSRWRPEFIGTFFIGGIHIETIGKRIKTVRKLYKISQVDFSNRIGISQATLSELEQDKYKPSVDAIQTISKQFGVNVEWILFGENTCPEWAFELTRVSEKEAELLSYFGKLKENDQNEIIEFIKLKINRYWSSLLLIISDDL